MVHSVRKPSVVPFSVESSVTGKFAEFVVPTTRTCPSLGPLTARRRSPSAERTLGRAHPLGGKVKLAWTPPPTQLAPGKESVQSAGQPAPLGGWPMQADRSEGEVVARSAHKPIPAPRLAPSQPK